LGGSGTLVSVDDVEGILTAKHVLSSLKRAQHVGLVVPYGFKSELHHLAVDMKLCSEFALPAAGEPLETGPDLAILVPPPDVIGTLRAKKSFYNLARRQRDMFEKPQPLDRGFWVLSGSAAEWASDADPSRGFKSVKIFKGGIGAGVVTREYHHGNFDYLIYEALYNDLYEGPRTFGGFSGGGLWQLLVAPEDGKFRVTSRLLSGVAFFQSDLTASGGEAVREITCHGIRSLYDVLIKHVRSQRPA
jgi:hypothetical protein